MWSVLAALLVVAGSALASSNEVTVLTDPADDGRVRTVESVHNMFQCGSTCREVVGEKAPPALEIVSLSFAETPDDLIVTLELEGLSDDLSDAAYESQPTDTREFGPGDHSAEYVVCWNPLENRCGASVGLRLEWVDGRIVQRSWMAWMDPECSSAISCQYYAPYEVTTGSPGLITWRVPRALLPNSGLGDTIDEVYVTTLRLEDRAEPIRVSGPPPIYGAYLFENTGSDWSYWVDFAGPGKEFEFKTPASGGIPDVLSSPSFQDAAGDLDGPDRPDLDILEVRFGATSTDLLLSVKKSQVREDPLPQTLYVNFGAGPEVPLVQFITWIEESERQFGAQAWLEYPSDNRTSLDATLEVTPGEPGWINFTAPLSQIDAAGKRIAWMWAGVHGYSDRDGFAASNTVLGPAGASVTQFQWDLAGPGVAYTFEPSVADGLDVEHGQGLEAPAADESTLTVRDDRGDAEVPGDAGLLFSVDEGTSASSYDIVGVEVKAASSSEVEVSLEIANLQRVAVPPGQDEVLYAAAIETGGARYLAVARFQPSGTNPNEVVDEWFCTADTAVLTDQPQPPAPGISIDGFLRPSVSPEAGGGQGQPATIRFTMPRECLGDAPEGPLDVTAAGGASFLVRSADTSAADQPQMWRVDSAQSTDGTTLEPPTPAAIAPTSATAGGLGAPFGFDNFWDIVGLVVGALASILGALLVRRRRSVLKAYLQRIEDIVAAHAEDPSGREAALTGVHGDAKTDLVDGRLTENQYVVVRDRLTEELAEARVRGIAEAFGDLPYTLLERLQRMVGDGALSPEDRRLFSTMLEDSGLTEEAKSRIRRKLDVWVENTADRA